jgi:mono/diheme cytochrome c family protein
MLETLVRHLDMVRLSVTVAAMVAAVGCSGLIDNHGGGLTPEEAIARQKFIEKALPVFQQNCVACHGGSMLDAPSFLKGTEPDDIRNSLIQEDPPVINLDAPASSRVLTKGVHSGPALDAQPASDILEWIQAEHDALPKDGDGGPTQLETALFTPVRCTSGAAGDVSGCGTGGACCPFNTVDLSVAPFNLQGASIKFIWQTLTDTDSYVNRLTLNASTAGAYIEHPLFTSWPDGKPAVPDTLDRFFNVKLDVQPNMNSPINGGTAAFVGFAPTDKISITFKVVSPYVPDGTKPPSGCKVLASFITNAQPQLNANCASCHGGANQGAVSAMDLTGIGNAGDMNAMMMDCNDAYPQVNLTTTDMSAIYVTPDPGSATNHPFKFNGNAAAFQAFKTAMDIWVQAEKVAP